jgi:ADP-heptose:LPS heptosyltransferase
VLFARLDNAGDVLMTGPAVRAVARTASRVTMLCGPAGRDAARLLPGVDLVEAFDAPWVSYDPPPVSHVGIQQLVERVRDLSVDQAFIATSFHQSPLPLALLLRLGGVPIIAATSDDYPGSLLDVRHRAGAAMHEVERSLSLVATLGYFLAPDDDRQLRVRGPLPEWRPFDEPYVVVHPAASVPARGIDPALGRDVVERLVDAGWRVVVTGGVGDTGIAREVAGVFRSQVADLSGRTDLAQLAGVLRGADALVAGNTGPAHLAAAVGTPVVSVFAPVVSFAQWRPWGVPVARLGDHDVPCAGCRSRVCPYETQPCTSHIRAEQVVDAVARVARPARERVP